MIIILMATYNGEKYISQQIDSILSQTCQDFVLYINDDNSDDNTYKIAYEYSSKYPEKVIVTKNNKNTGSAKHNFINMMIQHKNDYVMLSDQDDVWLPNKIEITYNEIKKCEAEYDASTPILVHTDLKVANNDLTKIISQSYKEAMNSDYNRTLLRNQIIQNTPTGCTMIYNRSLADLIINEPDYLVMHDWWIVLIAAAFGKIVPMDSQTVLYRQHNNNEVGAKDVRTLKYKIGKLVRYNEIKDALKNSYKQAKCFLSIFKDKLTDEQIKLLTDYSNIPNRTKMMRFITICRLGTFKTGFARKVAQVLFI